MMASNGVLVKQKVKLLNQTDSLNMIKNVVRLGISVITYLRDLFVERAYDDVVFQGMTLKMLKRVDKKSDMLLNWLDKGIFDAIEKQYLQMLIFDINDIEDNTIECYKFTFNYNREEGTGEIDLAVESSTKCNKNGNKHINNKRNEKNNAYFNVKETIISNEQRLNDIKNRLLGVQANQKNGNPLRTIPPNRNVRHRAVAGDKEIIEKIKKHHKKETARKAKQLLETLVSLTADLGPLPEGTYLSMKLLYYDEYTPEDYQPELFREPDEQDLISFQKKPESLMVGDLGTDHHALSVSISTTCTANRSWTIEELYEQLLLIERMEKIQKSFSSVEQLNLEEEQLLENGKLIEDSKLTKESKIIEDGKEKMIKDDKEKMIKNDTMIEDNVLSPQNLETIKDSHIINLHSLQHERILDTHGNRPLHLTEIILPSEHETNKQREQPHLYLTDNVNGQKEIQIKKKYRNENDINENDINKNDINKNDINKNDINENDINETGINGEKVQTIRIENIASIEEQLINNDDETKQEINYSNSMKNNSPHTENKNNETDEEEIKNYIISNHITSKLKLKKQFPYASDATILKILNELVKEGIIKKYKHGIYRFFQTVTVTESIEHKNEENSIKEKTQENQKTEHERKKEQETEKVVKEKVVKNDIKKTQSNNENCVQQNSSKPLKQITSSDPSQNHIQLSQKNILPLNIPKKKNIVKSKILPLDSSNETKKHVNLLENNHKSSNNLINIQHNAIELSQKKNQTQNNITDAQQMLPKLSDGKSKPILDTQKNFIDLLNYNKNEVNNKTLAYSHNNLIQKSDTETKRDETNKSEKTEETGETEKHNSTTSNYYSFYTGESGDENYNNVFNEIEKIYNDVCQSCKTIKYINKEIISRGLGIEPRLTKPLLDRLMKDGHVSKKFVRNKGYESFLFEPLQLTYKRKLMTIDISSNLENSPFRKKICS